jgi:hypothetical protein
VAILYRRDGAAIRATRINVMGKLDAGVETFNVPGSLNDSILLARHHILREGEVPSSAKKEMR